MESCGNCDHCGRNAGTGAVPCSGACGRTVPVSVANVTGLWLTTAGSRSWYCARCRHEPRRPVANEEASGGQLLALPELPPEVWIEIFTYLGAQKLLPVRAVCRRWRDLVDGSAALVGKFALAIDWNENDVRMEWNSMPECLPPAVSRISFRAAKRIGSWWQRYGPGIAEIKIEHKYNTSKLSDLLKLLKHAPNLKRFEMERGFLEGKCPPTGVGFRLDKLEQLVIACVHQCGKYLNTFRELCRNVRSLKFMWHAGEETADPQGLAAYVKELQDSLEGLEVNCCEEFLVPVMKLERLKLKKLTLLCEGVVEDGLLIEFFRKQPSLERLNLQEMVYFGEQNATMLKTITELLPKLKFLSICATHLDISFLYELANFQTLELISDVSITTLIQLNSIGQRRSNLSELNLQRVHLPDNCFRQWLPTLPNLRTLIMTSCEIGQWSDLLTALNHLPLLTQLTLKYCKTLSPAAPTNVNPATLTLKYLHFFANNDDQPEIDRLIALLQVSPDLRELQLHDVSLTDGILGAIFQYQRNSLKTLIVNANSSKAAFTDDYIRRNCPSLEEVDVYVMGPLRCL